MNMILHDNPSALMVQGNTLADPKFKNGGALKTFDYVVANPPFSDKRNLVRKGYIKGIIGLPANLFYGTGIPACIVVILFRKKRRGYLSLAVDKSFIKSAIYDHPEFASFIAGMNAHFAAWRKKRGAKLKDLKAGCHPKEVIAELSESLLAHYTAKPLIDQYDIYQHLMKYWVETMQDDCYLIAADGWQAKTYPIIKNGVNADRTAYGSGIPFINVLDIITKSHLGAPDIPGRVSLSRSSRDTYRVRSGDLVFNRTSETLDDIGLASIFLDDEPVVFGGFVIRGRPIAGVALHAEYAGYALRAPSIRRQIVARGQGAIRANIGQADLRSVLVPLPALVEQRAIAAILADLSAEITAVESKLTKARQIKQGMMQELLTGRVRLV